MTCQCIVIKHDRRCEREATHRCQVCGDALCKTCANKHHAHIDVRPIVPSLP